MCYEDGGIVDDLIIYRLSAEEYMMVVNGANIEKIGTGLYLKIPWVQR